MPVICHLQGCLSGQENFFTPGVTAGVSLQVNNDCKGYSVRVIKFQLIVLGGWHRTAMGTFTDGLQLCRCYMHGGNDVEKDGT